METGFGSLYAGYGFDRGIMNANREPHNVTVCYVRLGVVFRQDCHAVQRSVGLDQLLDKDGQ